MVVSRGISNEDFGVEEDGVFFEGVVVDDVSVEVDMVGYGFEVSRDGRDFVVC